MPVFRFKYFDVQNERSAMKVNTDGVLLGALMTVRPGDTRLLDIGTGTGVVALMAAQRLVGRNQDGPCASPGIFADTGPGPDAAQSKAPVCKTDGNPGKNTAYDGEPVHKCGGDVNPENYEGIMIEAIDVDEASAEEAAANFAASPWSAGMSSRHLSLDGLAGELASCRQDWKYDHIFSNPPYFESSLKAPDARRRAARHADTLSYRDIISFAAQRLTERGILSMILPSDAETSARRYAASWSLPLFRIVRVRTTPRHPVSRTVMEFSRPVTNGISGYPSSPVPTQPVAEMLTIRNEGGYSEEYRSLTSEFLFI